MIRFLTAGESHGELLMGIIEGIPSGLHLTADDINKEQIFDMLNNMDYKVYSITASVKSPLKMIKDKSFYMNDLNCNFLYIYDIELMKYFENNNYVL